MADAEYSGLSLDVTASTSKAVSDLNSLKSALKDILNLNAASKISEISRSLNSMKDINTSNTSKALESIKSISEYANNISSEQISKMTSMADAVSKLTSAGKGGIPNLKSISSFQMPTSSFYTGKYTTSTQSMPVSTFPKNDSITKMFSDANKQAVSDYNDRLSTLNNIASAAGSGLRSMGNVIKTITRYTKSGISAIGDLGSSLKDKLFGGFIEAAKGAERLKNAFLRIAIYRGMRTLIKDIAKDISTGMQNTYFWAQTTGNQFAASMDKIATASLYAKNSLGAMVAPLLNALSPAIDMIIDKFVALVNVINQVFSLMGGSGTWIKAIKYPTTYADAVGKAEKANKSFLASFDELNVIPAQSSNTTDYGGMFETQNISTDIKNMLNTADWTDLGKQFGDKLNAITDSADSWINNKFKPAIQTWSSRIATYLNGAVSSINFKNIGNTFADGLNAIIDGANNFMQKFKFYDFGKGIGDAVSAWFQRVDWNNIAIYLSTKLNSFIDVIHGFVDGLVNDAPSIGNRIGTAVATFFSNIKWDNIRETLKTGLHTIANFMEGFFKGEDGSFNNFGSELSDTIKSVLENPDTKKIIEGVSSFIKSIVNVISDLPWDEVGYAIGFAIGELPWGNIFKTAAKAIIQGLTGAIKGLLESDNGITLVLGIAFAGVVKGAFSYLITKLPALIAGKGGLLSALNTGIESVLTSLASSIPAGILAFLSNPITIAVAVIGGLVIAEMNGIPILSTLSNLAGKIVGWLASLFPTLVVKIIRGLGDMFSSIKNFFSDHIQEAKDNGGNIANGILDGIGDGFKSIGNWIHDHIFQPFIDGFRSAFQIHSPSQVMFDNGTLVSQGLLNGISSIDLLSPIRNFVSDIGNKLSSTAGNAWTWGSNIINNLKNGFTSSDLGQDVQNVSDTFSGTLGNLWQNAWSWGHDLLDNFSNGFNSAKKWLFDSADNVAGYLSGLLHFSRPDFGPLRDYESWMPDMMKGMANGINSNSYLVMDAVKGLADNMQKELSRNVSLTASGSTSYVAQTAYSLQNQENSQGNMMNSLLNMVNNSQNNSNRPIVVDNKLYLDSQPIYASVVKRNNDVVAQTGASEILV
ncbi:MAG: hypothetical protein KA953_00525 [Lachnospiraceae bacterium]|nr:hypothetical protein [Lachnospiraceae bacterium]